MKYIAKPIVVEAFQVGVDDYPDWIPYYHSYYVPVFGEKMRFECRISNSSEGEFKITEGDIKANKGDMVIKGINGKIYVLKKDIFDKMYEKYEDEKE